MMNSTSLLALLMYVLRLCKEHPYAFIDHYVFMQFWKLSEQQTIDSAHKAETHNFSRTHIDI